MQAVKSIDQRLADSFTVDIEQSVARGQLGDACKKLQDFVEGLAPHLRRETLALCFRHSLYERDRRHGQASRDDAVPIVNAILELASEVQKSALLKPQYRLEPTHLVAAKENCSPEVSNVTPFRPNNNEKAASAGIEELDHLRRFYWKRFRETRPPSDTVAFACRNISKSYGNAGFLLAPISFSIRAGEITGVVGRNASGKTTLLRIAVGELAGNTGEIEYPMLAREGCGWADIKRRIAYVSQTQAKWQGKVRHNLNHVAAAYGAKGESNNQLVDWHIHRFGLEAYQDFTWDALTGGYRTRFELVRALLSRPKFLVLDEPLAQLDVIARQNYLSDLETIANSFERPVPIIITSQHLYEIEAVANQMIVLDNGTVTYAGTLDNIGQEARFKTFEISLKAAERTVREAVFTLDLKQIHKTMEGYILHFLKATESKKVFLALYDAFGEGLVSFRDITSSTRSLFHGQDFERKEEY